MCTDSLAGARLKVLRAIISDKGNPRAPRKYSDPEILKAIGCEPESVSRMRLRLQFLPRLMLHGPSVVHHLIALLGPSSLWFSQTILT